jgi:YVTN family beta-propeller protein
MTPPEEKVMIAKHTRIAGWLVVVCLVPLYATPASSKRVIATIPVGDTPAGNAVTPDNRFVYVANNNNDSLPNGNTVSVIDARTNKVVTTISDASFNEPYTITINKAGTIAYVTNSNGTTITLISIETNQVIGTIGGFDGPSGMVITPDGTKAYVNNYGGPGGVGSGNATTVRVVDLTTNTIIGPAITVGLAPASLAITPDGAFVYVINYVDGNPGTGTTSIIRTSDNTVVGII